MIPSGSHKFKNALSDSIIFLDKEFDLVLDVMRISSRECFVWESEYPVLIGNG
jgi:hypothetical protein